MNPFSISKRIYRIDEFNHFLKSVGEIKFIRTNKRIEYANISASFDIESTSFYRNIDNPKLTKLNPKGKELNEYEKVAIEYAFVFGINGKCIIGRSWEEALILFNKISEIFNLSKSRLMIFYIHNLSYEFQFMKNLFEWDRIFSIEERKPVEAISKIGICFRCSLLLSGYSLEKVGEHLQKYKIEKKVGDLDYNLIRHTKTPLTKKELGYILNDGLVVMAYIQEEIERLGDITKIPLTKTGYVRKTMRDFCLYDFKNHRKSGRKFNRYRAYMKNIEVISPLEYEQLKNAFQGGFTHANAFYSSTTAKEVSSYDFTSSYPSVMVTERFPMSNGKLIKLNSLNEFRKYLKEFACLFEITFDHLETKEGIFDHYISYSKTYGAENYKLDNGRLVYGDNVSMTITEIDFEIIEKCYKFKRIHIRNFRIYEKDYLPRDFILGVLNLYKKKTELKGVENMEVEYLHSKEQLNSCYGMSVTDIVRPQIKFENGEWITELPDTEKSLIKYNKSKRRFLAYQWGVWVTAYARRNLWSGILELGKDYIYSDTDSVKFKNLKNHLHYFEEYNKLVERKLIRVSKERYIDFNLFKPKTIEGEEKLIGVWDYEGTYTRFKALGAKRYMIEKEKDGKLIHLITISGVDKRVGTPYLEEESKRTGKDIFSLFSDGLFFPPYATGKMIHTYIDEPRSGEVKDYLGNWGDYKESSGVHLEKTSYSLTMLEDYLEFIMDLQEMEF